MSLIRQPGPALNNEQHSHQHHHRVVGAGEMVERVRKHTWEATSLGSIDSWSRELTTAVNLTLASPLPARTLWGPDLILIYNDSYKTFPGKRHPEALGRPAREVYRESWHVVGPVIEQAFASGTNVSLNKFRVPIETEEGLKDFYLNYTYSPVFEDGKVVGLFGLLHDVTNEVTAVRSLRENEARSWRVLQSIGDAVIVTSRQGCVIQMNRRAESLTGWKLEQAANRPLSEVYRIIDEQSGEPIDPLSGAARRPDADALSTRSSLLIRKDGVEIPIDQDASPVLDEEKNNTGTVLVFRDMTERRAAEIDRDDLADQLALVLDATTDGIISMDRNWRMVYRNRRAQEILQPSGELTGRLFWDAFPEARCPGSPFVENYYPTMEKGLPTKFEAFYPEPLNAWFTVYAQPAPHGMVVFFRDITAHKLEAEALREREAKFKAIYSTSLEYIGLLTPEGVLVECNPTSLDFAALRREDVIGMPYPQTPWFASTPGAAEIVQQGIDTARAGETFRREISLNRPHTEPMIFDFSITPVRDDEGRVIYLVPEARDISEVKRAEAALLKSEKLAAVGRLASSIAHEINNPLESVMNLIYLARNTEGPDGRDFLDLADQEIRRVSIIANQTLRFHKQATSPQAVTASDLFSTVLSIYEGRLRNGRVQVEKKFRTAEPVVCFQGDVRQVLNNLVSNALEAMPFGGRLLIRSRKGRHWKTGNPGLVLTIADNGLGIPTEVRRHIFEAFYTTKGTAGNGLGLWVCQEIVARHHGALRVRSCTREGRNGTTFTFFLPFNGSVQERRASQP